MVLLKGGALTKARRAQWGLMTETENQTQKDNSK